MLPTQDREKLFVYLCTNGHLDEAQHLYAVTERVRNISLFATIPIFVKVCERGHLQVAQWIHQVFGMSVLDSVNNITFNAACRGGHLDMAQWLYQLDPESTLIRNGTLNTSINCNHNINQCFMLVCIAGHLSVAQWIMHKFQLTIDRTIATDQLFHRVCFKGHLKVAQWLFRVCPSGYFGFVPVAISGLSQWLFRVCPSIPCGPNIPCGRAFMAACDGDQLQVARWLLQVKPEHIRDEYIYIAYVHACTYHHLSLAKWLLYVNPSLSQSVMKGVLYTAESEFKAKANSKLLV